MRQDVQAAVLLANLESVLSEPAQAALSELGTPTTQPRQVNRSNSYHALKDQVLDLLYRDIPAATVINKLLRLFKGSPVAVRPNRKVPRRRKPSFHRSYHFQRRVKKSGILNFMSLIQWQCPLALAPPLVHLRLTGNPGPFDLLRRGVNGEGFFVLDQHSAHHAGIIGAAEVQN